MIQVGQIGFDMMYFVNESNDLVVGDLQFYKSKAEMLSHIEPWYEDVEHMVFDVEGNCYKIKAIDQFTTGLSPTKSKVSLASVMACLKYVASGQSLDWMPRSLMLEVGRKTKKVKK